MNLKRRNIEEPAKFSVGDHVKFDFIEWDEIMEPNKYRGMIIEVRQRIVPDNLDPFFSKWRYQVLVAGTKLIKSYGEEDLSACP